MNKNIYSLKYIVHFLNNRYNIKKNISRNNIELYHKTGYIIYKYSISHNNIDNVTPGILNDLFAYIKNYYGYEIYKFLKNELIILYKMNRHSKINYHKIN
jgi:hypothetical protein